MGAYLAWHCQPDHLMPYRTEIVSMLSWIHQEARVQFSKRRQDLDSAQLFLHSSASLPSRACNFHKAFCNVLCSATNLDTDYASSHLFLGKIASVFSFNLYLAYPSWSSKLHSDVMVWPCPAWSCKWILTGVLMHANGHDRLSNVNFTTLSTSQLPTVIIYLGWLGSL